jgi:hypothetical protein
MEEAGSSFVEVLVAVALMVVIGAASVPPLLSLRDNVHIAGAARHVAAIVYATRAESLKRGVNVALVFQSSAAGIRFAMFADGNYDGVRSADVLAGIDRQVAPWLRIGDQFPRASFGIVPGVLDPDSGSALSGSPLKLGGSSVLSFAPAGSATSGTVYLRGPAEQQFAIRLLGTTGRSRLLRFDFKVKRWVAT